MKRSKFDFVAIFFCFLHTVSADRVIMTTTGPLQGITVESEESTLEAYLGIPYAEPPVGRLRFARPVPKTPWTGVYDASRMAPVCIQNATAQYYYAPNIENMTEDCLYLNIWVPHYEPKSKLKPVLFFIHGGSFNAGSSNMKVFDGAKLASFGDVVVVTINYRIGVMGFFSAFIPDANGNMGAYDQVTALNWIRDNAVSFHGDPNHIVLVGHSAGAISAAGHMLSPLTKHMIKRYILQSGAAMLPMILDANARVYKTSEALASIVGCANTTVTLKDDPRLVVDCMKHLPAIELSRAEGILRANNPITFIPRVGDEVVPKNSIQAIRDGDFLDTEMLIGVNKDEGTFFLTAAIPEYFGVYGINAVKSVSRRFAYHVTRLIYKVLGEPGENNIANFYVNNVENGTSEKYTNAMSESIGDYMITCNSVFNAEFHALRRNPVYFYQFSHRPSDTSMADWMGTTHFDEIGFVFGNPLQGNFTREEVMLSRRMMSRWLSFAKTGNPNIEEAIEWPKYTYDNPLYLDIDIEESVKSRPDNYRCEFWRERYQAVIDEEVISRLRSSAQRLASAFTYLTLGMFIWHKYQSLQWN